MDFDFDPENINNENTGESESTGKASENETASENEENRSSENTAQYTSQQSGYQGTTYHYGVNSPNGQGYNGGYGSYQNPQSSSQYTAPQQPYGNYYSGQNSGYNSYPYANYNNSAPQPKQKKKKVKKPKKTPTWGKIIVLCIVCCLVTGMLCSGGRKIIHTNGGTSVIMEGERETQNIEINKIDTSKLLTASEVYAANVKSTVGITTTVTVNYFGYRTSQAAAGSGFIITEDGYILTNYHVIEDSNSIKVTLFDDTKYEATVVGYDKSNDVAVIKVDAEGLSPVVLGDSDKLNVGDDVIAIGNPLGELTFSLTKGVVSALDRSVTTADNVTMNLIQTDCAINSGNSGGALFNMYGEVVGITNAKYSSNSNSSEASIDNIGFAIPMANVKQIVMDIIEKGYVSKPYIGITVMTVSEETIAYGLPAGAAVKEITEGGPADKAGLKVNDIITAVNGEKVESSDDVVEKIGALDIGDKAELSVYRSGDTMTITVKIEEKVVSALAEENDAQSGDRSQDYSGGYGNRNGNGYGNYGDYGDFGSFEDFFRDFFGY